jgi:penicillin-binding protein 2
VVIAINPQTGEILAMVSFPTYENNRMARLIPAYYYDQLSNDPRNPLLNNAVQSEYPPGSTFNLGRNRCLNERVIPGPNHVIFAPGQLELCEQFTPNEPCGPANTRPFVDWIFDTRPEGFGAIDYFHCIAFSSNVWLLQAGRRIRG